MSARLVALRLQPPRNQLRHIVWWRGCVHLRRWDSNNATTSWSLNVRNGNFSATPNCFKVWHNWHLRHTPGNNFHSYIPTGIKNLHQEINKHHPRCLLESSTNFVVAVTLYLDHGHKYQDIIFNTVCPAKASKVLRTFNTANRPIGKQMLFDI
jgi:hypothetical protein